MLSCKEVEYICCWGCYKYRNKRSNTLTVSW